VVGLSNFSRLEILDLNGNSFTGSISPYIGALSSLKAISLGHNDLNGTLPKGKNHFFYDLLVLPVINDQQFITNVRKTDFSFFIFT
jgi:hypothetical protein